MKSHWSKIACLLAAVAAAVCALFAIRAIIFRPNQRAGSIEMTYQGRTNLAAPLMGQIDGATGQFAVLMLQNRSGRVLGFEPSLIEVQTQNGWVTNETFWFSPNTRYWPPKNWPRFGGLIGPAERLALLVPAPLTNRPWRIQFDCYGQASGLRRLKEIALDDMWHHSVTFSGPHFAVTSPTVAP